MHKYTLIWDNELHNTGIGSLDSQHREIVNPVNRITDGIAHGPASGALEPLVDELLLVKSDKLLGAFLAAKGLS